MALDAGAMRWGVAERNEKLQRKIIHELDRSSANKLWHKEYAMKSDTRLARKDATALHNTFQFKVEI